MIITEDVEMRMEVMDNIRTRVSSDRPDIHVSDVTLCLRKAYWRKLGLAARPSDELCLLWLTGYAFQTYMFPNDTEITYVQDGLYCTPDIPDGKEVKSTRASMGKFDPYTMLQLA
jgi:hypothetical protein